MDKKILFLSSLILSAFFIFSNTNFISADVISVNSGGGRFVIIHPSSLIEGLFSCSSISCAKMGYECGIFEDNCGKDINCGSCETGYTCSSYVCVNNETEVPSTEGGGGGGGGGGGSSGAASVLDSVILITPDIINLTLSFNPTTSSAPRFPQKIYILNQGTSQKNLTITISENLKEVLMSFEDSVSVESGESKEIIFIFTSPLAKKEIVGEITIGGKKIAVYLHAVSTPLWFDANIVVLNKGYSIVQGGTLKTKIELVPMGDPSKLDVSLSFTIKDYFGKVYMTKKDTLFIEDRMTIDRVFDISKLPIGEYIMYLELIYPGGSAPTTAHFEIVKNNLLEKIPLILILIMSIIILFLSFLIIKKIRKRKNNKNKS